MKLKANQDYQLVKACLDGDQAAFKSIFEAHAPKMMAVCARYARDNSEAEDWLQEGFIRAFNGLNSFKFNGSFEGWLRKVMVNNALKNLNRPGRKIATVELENFLDPGIEPEVISALTVKEIIHEINELPDGYRAVFNLNVIEGYSHKEIAEKLNITESTSRSQLVKAKRALKVRIVKLLRVAV